MEVKSGDLISSWDPYNDYIISEYDGIVRLDDFIPNVSYKERVDEDIGRSQKVIVDWSAINKSLNPRVVLVDNNRNPLVNKNGIGVARYMLPVDSIVLLKNGDKIVRGDIIARVPRDSIKVVRDITGGLPRVEDIFEARVPKEPAIISEIDGIAEFVDDYRMKTHLIIRSLDGSGREVKYAIPKGKHIRVNEGSVVRRGDIIVDGGLNPHDILAVSGINALTKYIIDEVQDVYRLQGVEIDNKHIEIIVKYMLQKVEIIDRGDSSFVNMQQYDIFVVDAENAELIAKGKRTATYQRVLQGITRASIKSNSFISAASFQETSKVLVEAAISGKKDILKGMKENVIVGRPIPAGTGFIAGKYRKMAMNSDSDDNITQ